MRTFPRIKSLSMGILSILFHKANASNCDLTIDGKNKLDVVSSIRTIIHPGKKISIQIQNRESLIRHDDLIKLLQDYSIPVNNHSTLGVSLHEESCTISITDFNSFIYTTPIDTVSSTPPNATGT